MDDYDQPLPKILMECYVALGADIKEFIAGVSEHLNMQGKEIERLNDVICDLKKENRK